MKKLLLIIAIAISTFYGLQWSTNYLKTNVATGAPPYDTSNTDNVADSDVQDLIRNWVRPEGPARVGLQVGHWQNDNLPEELEKLRGNTGASGGGKTEWEVNYEIAIRTKDLLEAEGVVVDLIPAKVPQHYWADAFISIHADGSLDPAKSGYKASGPWRDITGSGDELLQNIDQSYQTATGFQLDDNITRNMRGYYGFSWWRYKHAVHPMTPSVILETGFLSSPADRTIIVDTPNVPAEGLADGIVTYLREKKLIDG